MNTSELTGESKPVSITVRCSSPTFMESTNIGFYSSMVEQGTGEAVVIATGDSTVLGKMSKLTRGSAGDEITGLHREVNRFVLFVVLCTIIAIIILWITWGAWLNRTHPGFVTFNANIVNSIGMIVAFLPMGLPSAVTLGKYHVYFIERILFIFFSLNYCCPANVSTTCPSEKFTNCRNIQFCVCYCY